MELDNGGKLWIPEAEQGRAMVGVTVGAKVIDDRG